MSYRIDFERKPTYLHVVVVGQNTRENVIAYLQDVRRRCQDEGVDRVLIEEHLEGPRLDGAEVFAIVSAESERARALFRALAYVDVNADRATMKFAETVAINRGVPVRLFATIEDAEKWLEGRW